jgi:hypothetical protein
MAQLVQRVSLTDGWLAALDALLAAEDGKMYDLLVEVSDPSAVDTAVVRSVDRYLGRAGRQDTEAVANTIFPAHMAAFSADRHTLYRRYLAMLPRLRRIHTMNRRGTYFGRLIEFPLQADPARANQLELVIDDLGRQDPARRRQHIYELQIFAPGKDRWPEGFPCMSSLSLHLDHGEVRLAATYRNQYYMQRGLGNFIGLANLQRYIADEAELPVGALSIHAFHAERDGSQRDIRRLLDACRPQPGDRPKGGA